MKRQQKDLDTTITSINGEMKNMLLKIIKLYKKKENFFPIEGESNIKSNLIYMEFWSMEIKMNASI